MSNREENPVTLDKLSLHSYVNDDVKISDKVLTANHSALVEVSLVLMSKS